MLTRYWQWTSGPANAAESGLPFGPLRYRAWSWLPESGLPFGPLRYRPWTSGAAVVPPVIDTGGGGFRVPIDDRLDRLHRLRLQRDDELLLLVVAAFVTIN